MLWIKHLATQPTPLIPTNSTGHMVTALVLFNPPFTIGAKFDFIFAGPLIKFHIVHLLAFSVLMPSFVTVVAVFKFTRIAD